MKSNFLKTTANQNRQIENLESRICLDGSVHVELDVIPGMPGLTAIVTGDDADNHLTIQQTGNNSFSLEGKFFGNNGTLIDGAPTKEIHNVHNFLIDLGKGNDKVFVNGDTAQGATERFSLSGDFEIADRSGGTNVVVEDATFRGSFWSEFESGENFVQLIDSTVRGDVYFFGGDDKDFVGLFRSNAIADVHAELGRGADTFWAGSEENALQGSLFRGNVDVSTGQGRDSVKLDQSRFQNEVRVNTGVGNDELFSRGSSFVGEASVSFKTGNHRDNVVIENGRFKNDYTGINSGPGVDDVQVSHSRFLADSATNKGLTISGGAHRDTINVMDSFFGVSAMIQGNGGNDTLEVRNSRMRGGMPDGFGDFPEQPGFTVSGGGGADFSALYDLIIETTAGENFNNIKWVDNHPKDQLFAQNLSLVVSQTEEVHEQIRQLLDQLRSLQDLQITIEVRFITLNDDFFERVGIDFDFDVEDNSGLVKFDQQGPSSTIGFSGVTKVTNDLDLIFKTNSFSSRVPQFGGFDVNTAANFGFAILSDIEVFFLLQAAKADSRDNVLIAPKVTLFDGQFATINDLSVPAFVTSVTPVVG